MKKRDRSHTHVIRELNELRRLAAVVKSQKIAGRSREEQMLLLSKALENLSEMVLITDLDHKIIYVNAAAETILGYTPEEMIGHKGSEFFENIPGNPSDLVMKAAAESVDGVWKGDIFNRKKDGTLINVHLALNWLMDEENKPIGCVGITTDITLRKRMEKELKEANEELKKLDQLKSDFLSSVSHELRTPLTSIRSFADILLDADEEDEATRREFLTIIKEDTERLTRLINNVLDITRIEAGVIDWDETIFDVVEEVKRAIRSMEGVARRNEIKIDLEEQGWPYPVYADRDRIQQVVINLLSNAISFSPPGGKIRVIISSGGEKARGEVSVSVSDRGAGIEEKYRENIFEKFAQIPVPSSGKLRGSGLGLPICREIINHYGGRIRVTSSSPEGTTFRFTLPLSPESFDKLVS